MWLKNRQIIKSTCISKRNDVNYIYLYICQTRVPSRQPFHSRVAIVVGKKPHISCFTVSNYQYAFQQQLNFTSCSHIWENIYYAPQMQQQKAATNNTFDQCSATIAIAVVSTTYLNMYCMYISSWAGIYHFTIHKMYLQVWHSALLVLSVPQMWHENDDCGQLSMAAV